MSTPIKNAEQQSLDLGALTVPPGSDQPAQGDLNPVFGHIAGLFDQKPLPISGGQPESKKRAQQIEEVSVSLTLKWLREYGAIAADDRHARAKHLIGPLCRFGCDVQAYMAKTLRGWVAIVLFVREGLYSDVTDADNRQLYATEKEFIAAFCAHYGIPDTDDSVSRLRRAAELWLAIVEAGLSYPANLSILRPLLVLPSLALQLEVYTVLSAANAGKVPSLAAIRAEVEIWKKAKKGGAGADGRSWFEKLRDYALATRKALTSPVPDVVLALEKNECIINVVSARLEKQAAKKQKAASQARPPPASKPCPLTLVDETKSLTIDAHTAPEEIQTVVAQVAIGLKWQQAGKHTWVVALPGNAGKVNHQRHHVRELVTRLLERKDYRGPDPLPAQAA